uniref:Uncharacterized protein n=1 Tax=viral metagenome TaxID=1070528 RepID=A0A6C0C7S4_9ZZZZ
MENSIVFPRALEQIVDALKYCKIEFSTIPELEPGRIPSDRTRIILDNEVTIFFNADNSWTVEQSGVSETFTTYYLIDHILSCPSPDNFFVTAVIGSTTYMKMFNARVGGKMMQLLTEQRKIDIIVNSLTSYTITKEGIKYALGLDNGYWYIHCGTYSKKIEQNEIESRTLKQIHADLISL